MMEFVIMKPSQLRAWIRKYGDWGHFAAGLYFCVSSLKQNRRAAVVAYTASTALMIVALCIWKAQTKPQQVVGNPIRIAADKRSPSPQHPLKTWKLAFVRDSWIWLANGDGTNQRKVIADAEAPCW